VKRAHRHAGIPQFILGHHARARLGNYKGVDRWLEANRGKHSCACGCGLLIEVVARHHATGIPRFAPRHHLPPKLGLGPNHPAYKNDRSLMSRRSAAAFGSVVRKMVFDAFEGRCAWCGTTDVVEFDHVVPVSEGGSGDPANCQLLCANCHRWKTAITPNYRERRVADPASPQKESHARHR
jgi:5-methylcytosine-specific restriction endonuclease McrA